MIRVTRRLLARRALPTAAIAAVVAAVSGASPAGAVVPAPPAGAPAVESAPSSLVGLTPQLPPGVTSASAARGSHWKPETAIYGTGSTNDIPVRGAGGTTIRVNEIYPTTASGQPAPGPFPVLLTMTPYGKGQGGSSSPGSASSPGGGAVTGGADNYLAERGYIEVVEDVRGTGDAGGEWGLFDPIQQQDAIDVVNWAARLPHSDGRVGTFGPSYLGIDQMLLAGVVGPQSPLKAIFPIVSANDIYRDTSFMGSLLDLEFDETYLGLTGGLNTVTPILDTLSDPSLLSDLAGIELDHVNGLASYHAAATANILGGGDEAYDGSYWQARNPQNVIQRIVANHIPAYLVGGEFDIFQHGEPINYAELQNAWDGRSVTAPMEPKQRTTGRYQLIVGPWEHLNGSSVDVDPLELEWFDTWLKGERTGWHGPERRCTTTTSVPGSSTRRAPIRSRSHPSTCTSAQAIAHSNRAVQIGDKQHDRAGAPTGSPCGRPVDQWAMGGVSIPTVSAGILAPCVNDDQLSQPARGPSATRRRRSPARGGRRTDHGDRVCQLLHTGNRARRRARGRHPERRLLPAHRGRPVGVIARSAGGRSWKLTA